MSIKENNTIKVLLVDDSYEYSFMLRKYLEDLTPESPYWDKLSASWKKDEFETRFIKKHELEQFKRNQFLVHTISNPQDAITYLTDERPDYIIIDYHMPEMTGMELFGLLNDVFSSRREKDKSFKNPVRIILSSNTDGQLVLNMAKNGIDYYVEKGRNELLYLLSIMATGFYYEPDLDELSEI